MEPMTLGSPVNNQSNQSQYLPPFLMGDPQNMAPHNNTLSPKPGRFATSPTKHSPQDFNRSLMGTRSLFGGAAVSQNSQSPAPPPSTQHNTSHKAGPPIQGLFDSLRNDHAALTSSTNTPTRHYPLGQLNMSAAPSNFSLNQSYQAPSTPQLNESYAPSAPNNINASMRALCSPLGAHMSPLPSAQTPQARAADFWVTIFGFSPGASSMILQHFTLCGTIVDVVHAPQNGNWMHVRFSSRIESDKALNYNLKVIASNVMIGVIRCMDKSVMDKENCNLAANSTNLEMPRVNQIRPFAQQSYKIAQHETSVSPQKNVPQKSSGLMNKAMDLIFGW